MQPPRSPDAWAFAALLGAGTGASVVGATAAELRGWRSPTLPISVAIPTQRRIRAGPQNISILRLDVAADERVSINGLTTTTRLRTAVDVAHLLPLGVAQELLDRMLLLGVVSLDDLTAAVAESRRQGSAQARRLLRSAADLAASEAERIAHSLLRGAGMTGWTPNYKVTIKGRTSELQRAGWVVLTYCWYDLTVTPDAVLAEIRDATSDARARTPVPSAPA